MFNKLRAWRAESSMARAPHARRGAWRCGLAATVVLMGFLGLNLSGCGGGGGRSEFNPRASVTIQLRDVNGNISEGTLTLNNQTLTTSGGQAVFANLRPGTYQLTYDVQGDAFPAANTTLVISSDAQQTFSVVPGVTGAGGSGTPGGAGITLTGRILLNTGDPNSVNCTEGSLGVAAQVLVRVRDLNQPGRPIVASYIKPDQSNLPANERGRFTIVSVPSSGTYRIEVRQAPPPADAPPDTTAPFTGNSASFVVTNGQTQSELDICANPFNFAPGEPPPPPITPTPVPTVSFPTPNLTPGVTPGTTPGVTPVVTVGVTPVVTVGVTPVITVGG